MRKFGKGNSLHSIDWLLLASKFIAWWQEGVILSKSHAADWGLLHLNSGWKETVFPLSIHRMRVMKETPKTHYI
jgi:hypothetical protein